MQKSNLFFSLLMVMSLASCAGNSSSSSSASSDAGVSSSEAGVSSSEIEESSISPEASSTEEKPLISLFDGKSTFVGSYYGSPDSFSLPTYHHRDFGDVPFVDLSDFLPILGNENFAAPIVQKRAEHLYSVSSDGKIAMLVDTEANSLTITRYDQLVRSMLNFNNGIGPDPASPSVQEDSLVHPSEYSRVLNDATEEVYDLNQYHMDIVEADDKVYLPLNILSNLVYRTLNGDIIYNGYDYFLTVMASIALTEASCYTGNDTFRYGGIYHTPVEGKLDDETRRYVGVDETAVDESKKYDIFALKNDGTGGHFLAASIDAPMPEKPDMKIDWELKEGDIFMDAKAIDYMTGDYMAEGKIVRVRSSDTLFNKKSRSQETASFNYDLLRFQFDELYGLKEDLEKKQGYKDFDSFVTEKGLKEKLLSLDTRVYDEALAEFTMKYIDDGHTAYGQRSIYSGIEEKDGKTLAKEHAGPRRTALLDKMAQYQAFRKEASGDNDQIGLFMEGETAVIRFDTFMHIGGVVPPTPETARTYPLSTLMTLSTPFGFNLSFEEIAKNSAIDNVVIDLTCNQGGMVLTIPYLAAFFTKDPMMLEYDRSMKVTREYHYKVDLNANGVFGDEGDTYAGKYNFYILTSDFSFSCGSLLPCVAKMAGVKIIGMQGGGGACSVTSYTDANGSVYTSSSPLQSGYYDEKGDFVHDDAGVPVDYPLDKDSWYDLTKLNDFVKTLAN